MRLRSALLLALCVSALAAKAHANIDEDEWDPDEFEGIDEVQQEVEEVEERQEPAPPADGGDDFTRPPSAPVQQPGLKGSASFAARDYLYEALGLLGAVVYLLVYLMGRSANQRIANAWLAHFRELFAEQFAELGVGADEGSEFLKESQNEFKFFATGRRSCAGALVTLQLRARQDLLSTLMHMFKPEEDTLNLEIPLNEDALEPFVFAVCRRKKIKSVHAEVQDLRDLASVAPHEGLPEGFPKALAVLTDAPEVLPALLRPQVVKALDQSAELVRLVHVTDNTPSDKLGSLEVGRKALRLQLKLPSEGRMEELAQLTRMALWLIDHVGTVTLSAAARNAATRARQLLRERAFKATHVERQERMSTRKAERLRREDDEYHGLSKEAKRKRDAKEEKKRLKKEQQRYKTKIKMR